MAEPVSKTRNSNFIPVNEGQVKEIEINLLDICEKTFFLNDEIRSYSPNLSKDVNPSYVNLQTEDLPALFAFCEGQDSAQGPVGQGRVRRKKSNHENFYCRIIYLFKDHVDYETDKVVKHVGDLMKNQVVRNQNLNDIADIGEFIDISYQPQNKFLGDNICQIMAFEMKVAFTVNRSTRTSTR